MFKTSLKIIVFIFSAVLFFTACEKESSNVEADPADYTVATEKTVGLTDDNLELFEIDSHFTAIISDMVYKNFQEEIDIDKLISFTIEAPSSSKKRHQYVYVSLTDKNGETHNIAFQLAEKISPQVASKGPIGFAYVVSHRCIGDDCTCCSFIRDSSNNIIGCNCINDGPSGPCYNPVGNCNHVMGTQHM